MDIQLNSKPKLYETKYNLKNNDFIFITAVHNSYIGRNNIKLGYGKTLGGCRVMFRNQILDTKQSSPQTIASALARDMTYKWLILYYLLSLNDEVKDAELKSSIMGGGKSIILAPSYEVFSNLSVEERTNLFIAFGKHIENLNGEHITAVDMHTTSQDMDVIGTQTKHVVCKTAENGGTGNPSYTTALGVYSASVKLLSMSDINPNNATFIIQGVGEVGSNFIKIALNKLKAPSFIISDTDNLKLEKIYNTARNIEIVGTEEIYSSKGDIFVPCAIPNILNNTNIDNYTAKLICGGANDIYPTDEFGSPKSKIIHQYFRNGYMVAPAPAVNLGGILHVAVKGLSKYHDGKVRKDERANELVMNTSSLIEKLFKNSLKSNKPMEFVFSDIVKDTYAIQSD